MTARDIPESDWKKFRNVYEVALERFSGQILEQVRTASAQPGQSLHERYLQVYRIIQEKDRQLGDAFNDPRRSHAQTQLLLMHRLGVVEPEELAQFGEQTQKYVREFPL